MMIDWPSDKVPPGGVFHPKRPSYSKDTEQLLRVLMDEAKLTNLQRNKINYHLRNGEALPPRELPQDATRNRCFTANFKKSYNSRRRSFDIIKSSGAFEKPESIAGPFREPTDRAKKRLQEKMSGVKGTPRTARRIRRTSEEDGFNADQEIQRLLDEIRDRTEWLEDMVRLGEGKKYQTVIQNQISEKLREIKRLEKIRHEMEVTADLRAQLDQLKL